MSLSVEYAKEVLSKCYGQPEDVFEEVRCSNRGTFTFRIFTSKDDGDEYSIIANAKGDITEVKSSFMGFDAEQVKAILKPPVLSNPIVPPPAAQGSQSPFAQLSSVLGTIPTQKPALNMHAMPIFLDPNTIKTYVADVVKNNPGHVAGLDPAFAKEYLVATPLAWSIDSIEGDETSVAVNLTARNTGDPNFDDNLLAALEYDLVNQTITLISFEF